MNRRLRDLLSEVLGLRAKDFKGDMPQAEIAAWDSLKQMDLVMSLEREYGIELELADIVRMNSVANILAVLTDKGVNLAD